MSASQKSAAINKIKAQQQQQQQASKAPAQSGTGNSTAAGASAAAAPAAARARASGPARPARWAVDLSESRAAPSTFLTAGTSSQDVVPFGFTSSSLSSSSASSSEYAHAEASSARADAAKQAELLYASAMSIAQAPGKQLFMTAFMLWMSGNSLQIFSIMMLGMALWTPLGELFNVNQRFARFADANVSMLVPKITFVAIQLAGLALGLYKCNTMGLLPTATADWIDPTVRLPVQVAGGGL